MSMDEIIRTRVGRGYSHPNLNNMKTYDRGVWEDE